MRLHSSPGGARGDPVHQIKISTSPCAPGPWIWWWPCASTSINLGGNELPQLTCPSLAMMKGNLVSSSDHIEWLVVSTLALGSGILLLTHRTHFGFGLRDAARRIDYGFGWWHRHSSYRLGFGWVPFKGDYPLFFHFDKEAGITRVSYQAD